MHPEDMFGVQILILNLLHSTLFGHRGVLLQTASDVKSVFVILFILSSHRKSYCLQHPNEELNVVLSRLV